MVFLVELIRVSIAGRILGKGRLSFYRYLEVTQASTQPTRTICKEKIPKKKGSHKCDYLMNISKF